MRLAVNMESFAPLVKARKMGLDKCVLASEAMGVEAIELMDMLISDSDIRPLQDALSRSGLKVCSYDIHCDLVDPDDFWREGQLARVRVGLHRAAAFGSPLVLVIPGVIKDGVAVENAQQWFAEALSASMPAAEQLGIRLVVENIGLAAMARYCGRSSQINRIAALVGEQLGVVYDVGNFLMSGEDSLEALASLKPSILHVHFKDWQIVQPDAHNASLAFEGLDGRLYLGTILGTGIVNLRGALDSLSHRGYNGYLSVEYEGPSRPDQSLPPAVEFLRSLMPAYQSPGAR